MKYSEAKQGRVFIIRLEDGDVVHECVEQLAKDQGIQAGALIALGGADQGSRMVAGPVDGRADNIEPMITTLDDVHEVSATGTLFPNQAGEPVLHMHMSAGRGDETRVGCIRAGTVTWQVLELVLFELVDTTARRLPDAATGFELLIP